MSDWLILGTSAGITAALVGLERRRWGTWLTPTALLGVPYLLLATAAFLTAPALGFVPLHTASVIWWMGGLLLFWAGGAVVGLRAAEGVRAAQAERGAFDGEPGLRTAALGLAPAAIVVLLLSLRSVLSEIGGAAWLATEEFTRHYGYGASGHLLTLLVVLLLLLIGLVRRGERWTWLLIGSGLLLVMAFQVKTWIFVPLIAGLLYRLYSGRSRLSPALLAGTAAAAVLLFFGVYLGAIAVYNPAIFLDAGIYRFLGTHFFSYLYSGVLSFGEVVRTGFPDLQPEPFSRVLAWGANLWRLYAGQEYAVFVDPNYLVIDQYGAVTSNVSTLFGALYAYLGVWPALVYTLLLGVGLHLLFALALAGRRAWAAALWCSLAAHLLLGWHEFNFWHIAVVLEVPLYCAGLGVLGALIERRRPEGGRSWA
jgi:hypothetical protein